jgi:hypothetical protein
VRLVVYQAAKTGKLLALGAISLAFVLACVASANGQVTVGNNFKMLMNGSLGTVYSGNFGNYIGSSHSLGLGVNGTLEGSYYNPQFLYFQVRPYYDRAQFNSESQMITRGTGVEASASVFGGSHFPGSISYARNFDSNSEFQIAGVPSVLGDSSGSNFNVAWNALFSGLPTLQASYSIADSTSTLLGTTNQGKSSSRSFNLNSSYALGGFALQGRLGHYNTDLTSPSFLTAATISDTSSTTNYGVTATRMLPLSGSLGLAWSRTTSESGFDDWASNSYTASAGISPWQRLSISGFGNYTTNAIAALAQSFGDATPILPLVNRDSNSHAIFMNTTGTFMVGHGLTVTGYVNHRIQNFQGQNSANTQYGGTVNYQKADDLFGFLRFSIGVVNTATQEGNNAVGLVTNLGVTHKFGQWETTADFNYSQNTQTLFDIVTTSNYSYGGMLRRKINSSANWSTSFREARSGLTAQEGSNNLSDSFVTNLSWEKYSLSGSYSRSRGEALLGANGILTPTPIGSIISDYFLTFDARAYAITASTQLFRILTLSGGYTNVSSSATQKALGTFNNGDRFNARLTVRMRRLYFIAGFDHAVQESSAVPGGPRAVNSFYVSLSRWFNVF